MEDLVLVGKGEMFDGTLGMEWRMSRRVEVVEEVDIVGWVEMVVVLML